MTSASLTHLSLSGMRQIMEQKHDRSPRAEATCISVPVPTHLLYQTLTSYSTCLSHSSLIMSSRDHKSIYPRGQLLRICTKVLSMVLAHRIKTSDSLFNSIDTIYFLSTCQWILFLFFLRKQVYLSHYKFHSLDTSWETEKSAAHFHGHHHFVVLNIWSFASIYFSF